MQESLIPSVGDLRVQIPDNDNAFVPSTRSHQGTSLLKNFVYVKWLAHQVQLPGIRHRERKQAFHDSGQLLELVVEEAQRLSIVLCAARFGEQKFCLAVKNRQWCAQFVRGIRHKLA